MHPPAVRVNATFGVQLGDEWVGSGRGWGGLRRARREAPAGRAGRAWSGGVVTGLSSCSRKQFSLPHMPVCAQALDNLRLQDGLLQQLRKFRPLSRRGAVLNPKHFRMACHAVFRSVT